MDALTVCPEALPLIVDIPFIRAHASHFLIDKSTGRNFAVCWVDMDGRHRGYTFYRLFSKYIGYYWKFDRKVMTAAEVEEAVGSGRMDLSGDFLEVMRYATC